ncbi:alpha/beta fold hydrolase [Mycobacterium sp. NPDC003323]
MNIRAGIISLTAAAAATALVAGCTGAAAQPPEGPPRPTVVLVHGAFADSSSWNGVVDRLQDAGYPVIAAANPLRGLPGDAAYVRSVLDYVDGPVVLAGHSYGGSVISEAAAGDTDVTALVYIASFILDTGESTADLAAKFPGAELGPALDTVPYPLPDGADADELYIKQDEFADVFAADVPADVAALMAATQRPITAAALADPATRTAWKQIPSWNLITTQDLAIPAASMRFMGERADAHNVEIDASHAVTVSRPDAVADLITAAADATAR